MLQLDVAESQKKEYIVCEKTRPKSWSEEKGKPKSLKFYDFVKSHVVLF